MLTIRINHTDGSYELIECRTCRVLPDRRAVELCVGDDIRRVELTRGQEAFIMNNLGQTVDIIRVRK